MPLFESDAYRGIAQFQETIVQHFMRTHYAKKFKKKKKKKKIQNKSETRFFFSLLFERDRKRVQDLTLDAIANSTN
jgi:hypothetical protein